MDNLNIFEAIEKLYFDNRFDEVINFWEKNKIIYTIDNKSDYYNKILEAIATSYFEIGKFDKSLEYVDIQIKQLEYLEISKSEKEKKIRYYYLNKINLFSNLEKNIAEYMTVWEYILNNKSDKTFLEISNMLEMDFYKRFVVLNKYFRYLILSLIFIVILMHISHISIENTIYNIYNIFSISGIIWIVFNLLRPKLFQKYFLYAIRYFLRPSKKRELVK